MSDEDKRRILKEMIGELHEGTPPERVKERFKQFLLSISPIEIAKVEQELIEEGMPRDEIRRLCDVHLEIFAEQLAGQKLVAPPWSPISILMEEHKALLGLLEELAGLAEKARSADEARTVEEVAQLRQGVDELMEAEKHYLREENVLFPLLEKHGITEPPAIMWMEHDDLRRRKKELAKLIDEAGTKGYGEFEERVCDAVGGIRSALSSHIFKENNILFPTAVGVVEEEEWAEARTGFDEIGYCCFTPAKVVEAKPEVSTKPRSDDVQTGEMSFETGSLSKDEVEAILDTLPIDVTFVDKDDTVRYFNKPDSRIFVRTKQVIGRKVQQCHPQKSLHVVNRILEDFKAGRRDVAEFWIQKEDRMIHIRYFAVRDKDKNYLGTLEVTQDVTEIKKIEGEKRLLD